MNIFQSREKKKPLDELIDRRIAIPVEILLVLAAAVGLAVSSPNAAIWTLGGWVGLATLYVAIVTHQLMRAVGSAEANRELLPGDSPRKSPRSRQFFLDFTMIGVASAMGLTSAITVSLGEVEGNYAYVAQFLAPFAILLSWVLMQFGFARLYANTWFREVDGGGITFWDTEEPGIIEFVSYAFSPGSAYLTNSRMRLLATAHTVISLLYRTILFAYAVSMIPTG